MPISVRVAADLDNAGQSDARIEAAMNARPDTAREAGLRSATCQIEQIKDGLRVIAALDLPPLGPGEIAVFEHPDKSIWVSEASVRRNGRTLRAVTEMVPPSNAPFILDRSQIRITVLGAGRGVDIWGCRG